MYLMNEKGLGLYKAVGLDHNFLPHASSDQAKPNNTILWTFRSQHVSYPWHCWMESG